MSNADTPTTQPSALALKIAESVPDFDIETALQCGDDWDRTDFAKAVDSHLAPLVEALERILRRTQGDRMPIDEGSGFDIAIGRLTSIEDVAREALASVKGGE